MSEFALTILTQQWSLPDQSEGDLCSHGRLRLVVGGQVVANGEELYGLSPSALALLRTLDADHTPERPVAQQLVFHGCGLLLMYGCPLGIDWSVVHRGQTVELSDVRRHDSTSGTPTYRYPRLVSASSREYSREVVAF